MSKYTDDEYRHQARKTSYRKGELTISNNALVEPWERFGGVQVLASVPVWIFVSDAEIEKAQAKEQPE